MGKDRFAAMSTGFLLIAATAAWAQRGGSTPQGDILRGQGAFLRGAAWYEVGSAKARAIDANTAKAISDWNREIYSDYMQNRAEHIGFKKNLSKAQQEQAKRDLDVKENRLRTNPTIEDVVSGDALNALLIDLSDPSISDSQWRYAQVPLPDGLSIRSLVFQFVPRMKTSAGKQTNANLLAMGRLDAEGRWPIYLSDDPLSKERKDYESAYRVIRDQCLKSDLSMKSIKSLDQAIDALKAKAAAEVPTERDYRKYAGRFVDDIKSSARIFDAVTIDLAEEMIADMQGHDAHTVGELLAFMRKYRLLFASAKDRPENSDKYAQLHALLRRQKDALGLKPPQGGNPAQVAAGVPVTPAPPPQHSAKEQLMLARAEIQSLNFRDNPERAELKKHALTELNAALRDADRGTPSGEHLEAVQKDIESLQKQQPIRKPTLEILQRANNYVAGVAKNTVGLRPFQDRNPGLAADAGRVSGANPHLPAARDEMDKRLVVVSNTDAFRKNVPTFIRDLNAEGTMVDNRGYLSRVDGRTNVLCTTALSPQVPATVDFSGLTATNSGRLVLRLHSYPKKPRGASVVIRSDGKPVTEFKLNDADGWKEVVVPFEKNRIILEHHADAWNMEFLFIDYDAEG
jgi:hypothetical protein